MAQSFRALLAQSVGLYYPQTNKGRRSRRKLPKSPVDALDAGIAKEPGGSPMALRMTRRSWLKQSLATGAAWCILHSTRVAFSYEANEKVAYAAVGLGKRGSYLAPTFARIGATPVALCDANTEQLGKLAEKLPGAALYQDFRKMFDEKGSQIDAVVVATPDHTHAVVSAAALHLNKHVYCEKPISHDVREARILRDLANQKGVATQMGNQGMATDSFRRVLELLEDGMIGDIREVHVWFVFGGSGPRVPPKDQPPVPEHLNWDLWLGPAAERPYHPQYVSGWGGWWDFGTGCLGGGGSHSLNLAFKALKLRELWDPPASSGKRIRIESEIPEKAPHGFPRWQLVRFYIPARSSQPPAIIHWYNADEDELRRQGVWRKLQEMQVEIWNGRIGAGRPVPAPCLWVRKGSFTPMLTIQYARSCPLRNFPSRRSHPRVIGGSKDMSTSGSMRAAATASPCRTSIMRGP